MALDYADVKPRLDVLKAERRIHRQEQLQMQQHLGQAMAELLTDPKWSVYCQHVQALIDMDKARIESLRDKLSGMTYLNDQDTGQARVESAYTKGHQDALTIAMNLVKELVAQGEQAKDILTQEGENHA